jgi:hypothetical protein
MQLCKAKGTLVISKWKSALFWPMLVDNFTQHLKKFVIDFREYKHSMMFFGDGSQENSVFVQKPFRSNVLVLLIDFS